MALLPDEQLITSSNGDKVLLTNLRILLNEKTWGGAYSMEIFLEDISSVETRFKSNLVYLALGAFSFLSGLFSYKHSAENGINVGLIMSIVFEVLWWLSWRRVISIHPNGGKSLNFEVQEMSSEQIESFITKLQAAKLRRVNGLHCYAAVG